MTTNGSKHTPGPWKKSSGCGVLSSEDGLIAVVYDGQDYTAELCGERTHVHAASEANARLIAESPALLAACEALLEAMTTAYPNGLPVQQGTLCEEQDWNTSIRLARLAITRARGLA